jgi:hypothetical protein
MGRHNHEGPGGGRVELLEDARRRREEQSPAPACNVGDPGVSGDTYELSLGLAESVDGEREATRTGMASEEGTKPETPSASVPWTAESSSVADEVAVPDDGSGPAAEGADLPAADEILDALSITYREHERRASSQPGPRGSADLKTPTPRYRSGRAGSTVVHRLGVQRSWRLRWWTLAAAGALGVIVAIALLSVANHQNGTLTVAAKSTSAAAIHALDSLGFSKANRGQLEPGIGTRNAAYRPNSRRRNTRARVRRRRASRIAAIGRALRSRRLTPAATSTVPATDGSVQSTHSGSSSGGTGSSSAGSSGQPAFGLDGSLGPGHSPDS